MMNIKILLFAWTFCLVLGILFKIMHINPFFSDFLIGSSFLAMILLVFSVYKKIVSKQ